MMLYVPVDEPGFFTTQDNSRGLSHFLTLGQCDAAALIGRSVLSTQRENAVSFFPITQNRWTRSNPTPYTLMR